MPKELLTIQGLNSLSVILNIRNICSECSINYNTLKNKLYNSVPLPDEEAIRIEDYLKSKGLELNINKLNRTFLNDKIKVEVEEWYNSEEVEKNPNKIYVFGDNLMRIGKGGQATIRDYKNALGIATKMKPSAFQDSFFSDASYEDNIILLQLEVNRVRRSGEHFVFPKAGLGTGLADLPNKAPRTYKFLKDLLLEVFGFDNDLGIVVNENYK